MKVFRIFALFILIVSLFALPGLARAESLDAPLLDDKIVFGGAFTLESDEQLDGSLIVFGGVIFLDEGSLVTGDIVIFGGTIDIRGQVDGEVLAFGAPISLDETAVINGDLIAPGSPISREPGAEVSGQVITETGPISVEIPEFDVEPPVAPRVQIPPIPRVSVVDDFSYGFAPLTNALWFLFRTFAFSALAVLLIIFVPAHTQRAARAVVAQPVVSGGLGLLTGVVVPILLVILTFGTLFLLTPVTFLAAVVFIIAGLFGWIAVGLEVGRRLAEALNRTWTPPIEGAAGTFVLTIAAGLIGQIPCIGWLVWLIVGSMGLGGVLLTRFGSLEYTGPAPVVVDAAEQPAEEPEPKPKPRRRSTRSKKEE